MSTVANAARAAGQHCPGCLTPTVTGAPHCRSCGIWLAGPQVAELRSIDAELTRVDSARTWLITRRGQLLDELIRLRRQSAAAAAPPPPSLPEAERLADAEDAVRARPSQRAEISGRTAARLLLVAGAALVAVAITIFTVASWSRIGPLGRCAILLAVTAGVLAAPRLLVRRSLTATAGGVPATGLVLTLGDAYLIHRFTGLRIGPLAAAALCGAGAATWAAYGTAIRLRGPRLAAIGLAQFVAPLAFLGLADLPGGPTAPMAGTAAGLIVTAAGDIVLAALLCGRGRGRPEPQETMPAHRYTDSWVAAVAAVIAWICGVLTAVIGLAAQISSQHAQSRVSWSDAAWLALIFAAAALVGGAGPARNAELKTLARPAAVVSGALAGIGLTVLASPVLSASWELVCTGACGFCVSVAALSGAALSVGGPDGLATSRRRDFAAGSAALLTAAAAVAVPAALAGMIPAHQVLPAWSGPGTAGPRPAAWPSLPAAITLLGLFALACLLAQFGRAAVPERFRLAAGTAGLIAAAVAAGSLPAAAQLAGWTALIHLTAATAILLAAGVVLRGRVLASVAAWCGFALALTAAAWSLAGRVATLAELAALAVTFALAAARARHAAPAVISTAGALAATTGLAWAAPLAAGWPAERAALSGLGVAVAAIALATALRRVRPVHAVVLDLGACLIALVAAAVATRQQDIFAIVAVTSAVVGSASAWMRTGRQRSAAAAAAACAGLAAILAQAEPLGRALLIPAHILAHPWRQPGQAIVTAPPAGLSLAVVVFAVCLGALAAAAGAWRGSRRVSMDALAVALPLVAAPAGLASLGGFGYLAVVGALLVLTLALTAWAALGASLAPAVAAVVSAALTVAWALAEPLPTLVVLGGLAAAYVFCAWRSRLAAVRIAGSCLSVFSAAAFAEAAMLAAGFAGWQAGLAALGVAAAAQIVAARISRLGGSYPVGPIRPADVVQAAESGLPTGTIMSLCVEVAGWLVTAAGVGQCLGRPGPASAATAVAGITSLGVATRADRRPALWPGLALCYVAWCIGLAAKGVSLPEPYTVPAALTAIAAGAMVSRREPRPHSWLAYGPGLALLLLPSLVMAWAGTGWIRPVMVGLASIAIAVLGARTRRQAPLLAGTAVAVLAALRGLAPDVTQLMHELPGWVPAAAGGAVLLWAGATYEARLRNLRAMRRSLASMS